MKSLKRLAISVLMVFAAHWVMLMGIWILGAIVQMVRAFYHGGTEHWTVNMDYLLPMTLAVSGLFMFVIWPVKRIMVFVTDINKEYSIERFLGVGHTVRVTEAEAEIPGFVEGKIKQLILRDVLDVFPAIGVYWVGMIVAIVICHLLTGNGAMVVGTGGWQLFMISILPFVVMGVLYKFSFTSRLAYWYQS